VTAPTLWEEGRWSGGRVTRLAVLCCLALVALDAGVTGRVGILFDLGFALVCVGAALAVHPRDFFRVGVLPPALLVGCTVALSIVARSTIANPGDGFVQGVVLGLTEHAGGLVAGYALALAVLGIRHRVLTRATRRPPVGYSNRDGSPAPYRAISGRPAEKSTTVVGEEPASPESTTASTR
jgi:hypothetical protein